MMIWLAMLLITIVANTMDMIWWQVLAPARVKLSISLIAVRAEVLLQCESLAPESVLLTDVLAPPGESKLSSKHTTIACSGLQ